MQPGIKIVGIGGSSGPGSTVERALQVCLNAAKDLRADVRLINGAELTMPLYTARTEVIHQHATTLIREVADSDAVVVASPAYHGTVSGLVKNALDHLEELREDSRPYLSGRAVGCIAVGQGWQGAVSTLATLRDITHALRGWPTPIGVAVSSRTTMFGHDGQCDDTHVQDQLTLMAQQMVEFARMRQAHLISATA
ncbi:NADPH-dependent FMN reductase [Streptomyces benahoarensis]|uniref:NAD(P)H-dependent oxidoreductase n=1 Tax=Streptomyces benahoarensis TaxID=2595054 RepID=A0A553ZRR2_9ACTN|nr:NAD(P)H-dependent oxidoreductase [Streptomyces benahoarensis]TSB32747.1 NAD(P)H-dependent oxidoreductase [Streptomyces benahoarensis]TSB44142.1 NAD(P)H-dependent oxidoreductase [Streptomyces benahoarensis]